MFIENIIKNANKFITDRDWWQFHNPKNDAINILVESSELIEHFIDGQLSKETLDGIKDELADVLLATTIFCISNKIDILNTLQKICHMHESTCPNLYKGQGEYQELQDFILNFKDKFNVTTLEKPQQIATALLVHASKITDLFIWCSEDYSTKRAQEKQDIIITQIGYIFAHIIYLAHMLHINLSIEFERKMQHNIERYPVDISTGEKYMALKDKRKNNI